MTDDNQQFLISECSNTHIRTNVTLKNNISDKFRNNQINCRNKYTTYYGRLPAWITWVHVYRSTSVC